MELIILFAIVTAVVLTAVIVIDHKAVLTELAAEATPLN